MRTCEARLERASSFLELVAHVWPKFGLSVARGYASGQSTDHWAHGPRTTLGSRLDGRHWRDHWVESLSLSHSNVGRA